MKDLNLQRYEVLSSKLFKNYQERSLNLRWGGEGKKNEEVQRATYRAPEYNVPPLNVNGSAGAVIFVFRQHHPSKKTHIHHTKLL